MEDLLRVWCRFAHHGRWLRRHILGHGTLACHVCGAVFEDLKDAGLIEDLYVMVPRPGMEEPAQPTFVATLVRRVPHVEAVA